MAGFKRVSGPDLANEKRTISGLTLAVGDLLMASRTAGTLVEATSSATVTLTHGGGIVAEAATASDTEVEITPIDYNSIYSVECTNDSNSSHRYMRVALTDDNTVNNGGADDGTNGILYQVGEVGASSNKTILVKFLPALT